MKLKESKPHTYIRETNAKTNYIIQSCESLEQLTSASKWTRLLWSMWRKKLTFKGVIDTEDGEMLITLMSQHHKSILRKQLEIETLNNY